MAKVLSKADFVKKWQQGFQGASAAYQAGVQGTTKDPTALAADPTALAKASANYSQAAGPGGRMQVGLQRAGKQGWLQGCVTAGVRNLATGATKGANKLNGPIGDALIAAQQAAHNAAQGAGQSSSARWQAAVNAMRQAFGKGPVT